MYTKTTAKNGRVMYFKDKKLVAKRDIPVTDLAQLEGVDDFHPAAQTVDPTATSSAQLGTSKVCIYCGQAATSQKFINGKTALLCQNDYDNHTTGEIWSQMRKNDDSGRAPQ